MIRQVASRRERVPGSATACTGARLSDTSARPRHSDVQGHAEGTTTVYRCWGRPFWKPPARLIDPSRRTRTYCEPSERKRLVPRRIARAVVAHQSQRNSAASEADRKPPDRPVRQRITAPLEDCGDSGFLELTTGPGCDQEQRRRGQSADPPRGSPLRITDSNRVARPDQEAELLEGDRNALSLGARRSQNEEQQTNCWRVTGAPYLIPFQRPDTFAIPLADVTAWLTMAFPVLLCLSLFFLLGFDLSVSYRPATRQEPRRSMPRAPAEPVPGCCHYQRRLT